MKLNVKITLTLCVSIICLSTLALAQNKAVIKPAAKSKKPAQKEFVMVETDWSPLTQYVASEMLMSNQSVSVEELDCLDHALFKTVILNTVKEAENDQLVFKYPFCVGVMVNMFGAVENFKKLWIESCNPRDDLLKILFAQGSSDENAHGSGINPPKFITTGYHSGKPVNDSSKVKDPAEVMTELYHMMALNFDLNIFSQAQPTTFFMPDTRVTMGFVGNEDNFELHLDTIKNMYGIYSKKVEETKGDIKPIILSSVKDLIDSSLLYQYFAPRTTCWDAVKFFIDHDTYEEDKLCLLGYGNQKTCISSEDQQFYVEKNETCEWKKGKDIRPIVVKLVGEEGETQDVINNAEHHVQDWTSTSWCPNWVDFQMMRDETTYGITSMFGRYYVGHENYRILTMPQTK